MSTAFTKLNLSPHQLEKRMSASEDVGPRKRVDYEVPHRLERRTSVSEDTGPKGGGL